MEEVLPPQTQEGAGYEPARVRQFTVFLENRVGKLQGLVQALEEGAGPIVAIAIDNSADAALVRLICADSDQGRASLQNAGFSFSESDLLAVELPRRNKHPLIAICSTLLAAEINIHYVYPFLVHPRGAAIALAVDDATLAERLLIKKGFSLLAESDLGPQ